MQAHAPFMQFEGDQLREALALELGLSSSSVQYFSEPLPNSGVSTSVVIEFFNPNSGVPVFDALEDIRALMILQPRVEALASLGFDSVNFKNCIIGSDSNCFEFKYSSTETIFDPREEGSSFINTTAEWWRTRPPDTENPTPAPTNNPTVFVIVPDYTSEAVTGFLFSL